MSGVAAELHCDPAGLHAFAGLCESHALALEAHHQLDLPTAAYQSTVAAVSGLHGATADTATKLARRVRSTARAVRVAADRYARTDELSAPAVDATMPIGEG